MTDYLQGPMIQSNAVVYTTAAGIFGNLSVTDSTLPTNGMYLPTANTLGFATNGTQKMIVDANGNVGIATTSMSVRLQVSAVSPAASATWASGTDFMNLFSLPGSSYSEQSIAFQEAGSNIGAKIGVKNTQNGAMDIIFANRNTSSLTSTMTERMRITSGGNVLIGQSNDINRRLVVAREAGNNAAGEIYGTDGTQWYLFNSNAGAGSYNPLSTAGDHAIIFSNGTQDTGNFLIAPWSASSKGIKLLSTGNVAIGQTTAPLTLTVAGDIAATRNVYSNYSDLRLKTKVGDIESALDKVSAIDTLYYEPNQTALDLGAGTGRSVGVSAQSVQAVMPETIGPSPLDTQYMTVQYERLVPLLIAAIKELRQEVQQLRSGA